LNSCKDDRRDPSVLCRDPKSAAMQVSIVIPAYNEARHIEAAVASARQAMSAVAARRPRLAWRVVVTDNNSSDATARLARRAAADRVVFEPINQISRARNAGARAAMDDVPASQSHWLIFLDADSRVSAPLIEEVLHHADAGHVAAGGAMLTFEPRPPFVRWAEPILNVGLRLSRLTAGAFIFCRSDAFVAVGGFRLDVYAAEDAYIASDVRRWARPRGLRVILLRNNRVVTSSRKLILYRPREIVTLLLRFLFSRGRLVKDKSKLRIFYDGRRDGHR
jgi:glycosyltransferase involved in cell wall biosynthesis